MVHFKKTITTSVMVLLSLGAFAQQDAGFSMYFFDPLYYNPGYAGTREVFSGIVAARNQWIGMPGAPTTQSITMHSALPNKQVGLGLKVYNDIAGPLKNTGINLTYAYHFPINRKTNISFGLTGMLSKLSIDWSSIHIDNPNDQAFEGNAATNWVSDASAGVYLYQSRFYAGFSVNHLFQSKFGTTDAVGANHAKFYRQYYLTSGIVLPINENVDFRPSLLAKYVQAAPAVGEIDGTFIFYQKLFLGAGFRTAKRVNIAGTDNMIIALMQFKFGNALRIGYSYDYYLNQTGSYNSGTHEFMLGWDIIGRKTKLSSPRFF